MANCDQILDFGVTFSLLKWKLLCKHDYGLFQVDAII